MPGGSKPGGGLRVTPYKMKNSALHTSARHGSPMQKNYDNPSKKDFINTFVKEGVKVPKKTTQENLTRNQNQVPSEGGKGNTTTTAPVNPNTTKKFKKEGRDKVKTQHGPKWQMPVDSSPSPKSESTTNKVVNTLNTISPKNIYNKVVPKPLRDLNKGIVNFITNK